MPCRCCVPFCKGNYSTGPKVSIFSFPKDVIYKRLWLLAIKRKKKELSKSSRVCELHFVESDFITESSAYDPKTGRRITCKLSRTRLKPDAVPSQFPNLPSYYSKKRIRREDPDRRRMRLENEHLQAAFKQSLENNYSAEKESRLEEYGNVTLLVPVELAADMLKQNPITTSTAKEWKKDEITVLIALYQSQKCLYDKSNPNYNNSEEENKSYRRIQTLLANIRQNCSISEIKTEIKSLHAQYASEKAYMDSAIQAGQITEHSYEPVMWCFGLLQFLDDHIGQTEAIEIKTEVLETINEDGSQIPMEYDNPNIKVEREGDATEQDQQLESLNSITNCQKIQEQLSSEFIAEERVKVENLDVKFEDLNSFMEKSETSNVSSEINNKQGNVDLDKNNETPDTDNEENYWMFRNSCDILKRTLHLSNSESDERDNVFGEYIASEMRTLKDNSMLYLQTRQSIIDVLTSASFEFLNPE